MIEVLIVGICVSLLVIFCCGNFFVSLVAIKLLIDILVLGVASVRGAEQAPFGGQATAVILAGVGVLIFFVIMASGIQRFSKSSTLDLETNDE